MLEKLLGALGRYLNQGERDRIDEKFDRLDQRLDTIEKSQVEQYVRIMANREISVSDNEALEQKLNCIKAGQDSLHSSINLRFSYVSEAIGELKSILMRR